MSSSNCHLTLLIYISFLLKKEFAYIYIHIHTCLGRYHVLCCAKLLQSCLILCDPMDYSSPGFSVHEILQARILEWVALSSSRGSSVPGVEPVCLALAGGFFTTSATWETLRKFINARQEIF